MTGSAVTIEDVRDFFVAVLAREAAALHRIEQSSPDLEITADGFVFTLPALHALLDPAGTLAYRDFRKLLYESTLNRDLSAFDAEVVVDRSTGKTDTSLYCLRRRPAP